MAERPNPARVVADADVLAADLLVGGVAREALDLIRSHSWIDLAASEPLLERCEDIVESHTDESLATDHRERLEAECVHVDQPEGDHPALASAYRSGAAHLLSFDEQLVTAKTGVRLQGRVALSVRSPEAFLAIFDPERLYQALEDGAYPGPDRDPRA